MNMNTVHGTGNPQRSSRQAQTPSRRVTNPRPPHQRLIHTNHPHLEVLPQWSKYRSPSTVPTAIAPSIRIIPIHVPTVGWSLPRQRKPKAQKKWLFGKVTRGSFNDCPKFQEFITSLLAISSSWLGSRTRGVNLDQRNQTWHRGCP